MSRRTSPKRASHTHARPSHAGTSSINLDHIRRHRYLVLCFFMLFGCAAIIVRAGLLQFFPDPRLTKLASRQFHKTIELTPRRGMIYDAEGRVLAMSVEKQSVYAMKQDVSSPVKTARLLAPLLNLNYNTLIKKLRTGDSNFVWISRRIEKEVAERIQSLQLPGIGIIEESKRIYPQNHLAAQVLGFVGIDGEGLEGVELRYDKHLQGEREKVITLRDRYGRPIYVKNNAGTRAREGKNITLTINSRLQYLSEKYLEEQIHESKGSEGVAILMDPNSGAIRAMAVWPTFDPNNPTASPLSARRNRAITDLFEPGSTFKIVTVASALENNAIGIHERFDLENGRLRIGNNTIKEAHDPKLKSVNARELLMTSSNIASAKIALRLGGEPFLKTLSLFGFGKRTGIDLPGEAAGIVKPLQEMRGINLATAGFGQGVSTTALQVLSSFATIANEGVLVTPYVVEKIVGPDGATLSPRTTPPAVPRAISKANAKLLATWLSDVVTADGTAPNVAIPNMTLSGKTGTAQKPDPKLGGYLKDSYVASFVGFAPTENPQMVLLVAIHNPHPVYYGGLVAGPAWKNIATAALQPATDVRKEIDLPSLTQQRLSRDPELESLAKAEALSQPLSLKEEPRQSVATTMPALRGMSLRSALNELRGHRHKIRIQGSGRVITHSPEAHAPLGDTTITLILGSPE